MYDIVVVVCFVVVFKVYIVVALRTGRNGIYPVRDRHCKVKLKIQCAKRV